MRTRVFGTVCTLLFAGLRLSACDCGPARPACAYASSAAAIFIGTVTFTDHNPALGLRQRTLVRFNVEEAFKGFSPEEHELWIDPGSFTSCYAEYSIGERLLVFAYGGGRMPPDTSLMSVVPGQPNRKPLPKAIDPNHPPVLYSAPECSGTRSPNDALRWNSDIEYLRQYRSGTATPSARGRVTDNALFWVSGFDPLPGLPGVTITLAGNGIRRSARSDADGYYVIDNIPAGAYAITPSLPPYVATTKIHDIQVAGASCGTADFLMIAPGVIRGTLIDTRGNPAVRVPVEVLRLNGDGKLIFYAQNETNRDGRYELRDLPEGDFQVGVNLRHAPDEKLPYAATIWSTNGVSSIHLKPGERKQVAPFRLPQPFAVRKFEAEVRWPDGQPAPGVTVWGEVGNDATTSGVTDSNGLARLDVLQGIPYRIEAKVWVGTGGHKEVARSGAILLTPGKEPIHLKLVLGKRTQTY
jgi:Carboxypeptidase regulatory-like domain